MSWKNIPSDRLEESNTDAIGTTVLPALIQIQGPLPVSTRPETRKRRIFAFLDHPLSRNLGFFSWLVLGVAVAAAKPITAAPVGIVLFIGLLIGSINGLRWLFGPK